MNASLKNGIRELTRMKDRIGKALTSALDLTVSDGVKLAKVYSSGNRSLAQLRREGHPYAKRHENYRGSPGVPALPYGDAGIINDQGGGFKQDWRGKRARLLFGSAVAELRNDSEVADYLDQGTTSMIRRPIRDKLEAVMAPDLARKAQSKINEVS